MVAEFRHRARRKKEDSSTMAENNIRSCPYCKEEIRADAIRCKHCRSAIAPEQPPHGGTCPYCKETIHPEAIKCKHCGSSVGPAQDCGCGDSTSAATIIGAGQARRDVGVIPPGTVPGGRLPIGVPLALGCGPCHVTSSWGAWTNTGEMTCLYLVCTTIGNFHYCQVVAQSKPCGMPKWGGILE